MTATSCERTEWSEFLFCPPPFLASDKLQSWHGSFVACMQELFGIIKDEKAEKEAKIAHFRHELDAEQSKNKVIGALNKKLLERVGKLERQLQQAQYDATLEEKHPVPSVASVSIPDKVPN